MYSFWFNVFEYSCLNFGDCVHGYFCLSTEVIMVQLCNVSTHICILLYMNNCVVSCAYIANKFMTEGFLASLLFSINDQQGNFPNMWTMTVSNPLL